MLARYAVGIAQSLPAPTCQHLQRFELYALNAILLANVFLEACKSNHR